MDDVSASADHRAQQPAAADALGVVPGLVRAFRIHADGSPEALPVDRPVESRPDTWLWLHLNLADQRVAPPLRALDLPPAVLALLLSHDTHQQIHAGEGCAYGVFADLVRPIGEEGDEIGYLRFAMTERFLISGRHHALKSCAAARYSLAEGKRRLPRVAALLELMVEHVGDAVAAEIDEIEDRLALRTRDVEWPRLARVRRTAVRVHRQVSGLRLLFHRLERQGLDELPAPLRIGAGRIAQRLDALDREIVVLRERTRLLQEEISALTAEETNRH